MFLEATSEQPKSLSASSFPGIDPLSIPTLVREPPLKRGDKRDSYVYPATSSQLSDRVPLREPPLKRSDDSMYVLVPDQDEEMREDYLGQFLGDASPPCLLTDDLSLQTPRILCSGRDKPLPTSGNDFYHLIGRRSDTTHGFEPCGSPRGYGASHGHSSPLHPSPASRMDYFPVCSRFQSRSLASR